ncbi:unnamed protein product [Musa acuminata subsp. malaccensis]|uniref:(wild Malaysian banana) hypothetical protein n=1 Tax=Musa acuminata subsp. malaccensis TaxID=214687 RepID=A0A804IMN6_MUSAM|nr:unnamed protein product [Musa acuminata subsp. malaccensis]
MLQAFVSCSVNFSSCPQCLYTKEIDSLLEHIYTKYVSEVLPHQVFGMRNVDLLLYYYNLTDSAA